MITLQFWRGYYKECLISVAEKKSYKIVELGYPLLSFISDLEISYDDFGKDSPEVNHVYWGAEEFKYDVNLPAAKMCQSMFRRIFDEKIKGNKALDLKMFEDIVISYGFEVPFHGIAKQNDNGKEITCDLYRCFFVRGLTREVIEQLCVAELHYLATNGYTIKRCANCGKLFIPKKADEKYCIRRSKEYPNMNCKQAAKYKKQILREKGNETARIYHSIYTMMARRAKEAPPSTQGQAQQALFAFTNEAAEWREKLKSDPKIEAQYITWLNSFKKRKSKNKHLTME